jgi:nicotinamide mononucleotide transporter
MDLIENIFQAAQQMSWIEVGAVLCGVVYVILAARENIWCWSFGIANALLSMILLFQSKLYAESGIQLYYVAAGIYGWYAWSMGWTKDQHLAIVSWTWAKHIPFLLLGEILALGLGYLLDHFTDGQYPWLDAHLTIFSFVATWLSTRKVLENWMYWILIDTVSIWLSWQRSLYLYALLMTVYSIVAFLGLQMWKKRLRK